jgi:hypothetical protein
LLFVCFVDEPKSVSQAGRTLKPGESHEDAALKQELAETRTELHDAILNLEESNEEQKAINEDALSVNEEFQSTNEELLTSKAQFDLSVDFGRGRRRSQPIWRRQQPVACPAATLADDAPAAA